jgi:N-acetyl-anhydromuramyl-L-alanine amidase AmpD
MTILDGIPFLPSPNHASRNGVKITDIVLHWMDGTLAGADGRFANAAEEVSAHYGIEGIVVHQYVALTETAWHSGDKPENQRSIGIEHSADPKRPASAQTIATSVALITALCRKYSIDPSHIYPHKKFYPTQCPGTLPIADIIVRVRAQLTAPTGDVPMSAAEVQTIVTALANHETNEANRYVVESNRYSAQTAQIAALTAVVAALAAHPDLTAAQITTIISDAISASVKVTGTLTVVPN